MIDIVKGKKVKIGVAFGGITIHGLQTKYYEGIVRTSSALGGEYFIVFEDDSMINAKYIQTIEIIG